MALRVLGGGSNLLVADAGVDALVLQVGLRGITTCADTGDLQVTAAAGEPWDGLVRHTVEHGWAGLECLSGIPGLVGATPIQNVGAYGQEVADTIAAVRALDTRSGEIATLPAARVRLRLPRQRLQARRAGTLGSPRGDLSAAARAARPPSATPTSPASSAPPPRPTLAATRAAVLTIRRAKSMVLDDPADANRRSCGSFFLNPILAAAEADAVTVRAGDPSMPRWAQPDGRVKLSAAWLIEHAGFSRGERAGPVGLSSRHTLAIVAHDGARAADVAAFARGCRPRSRRASASRSRPSPCSGARGKTPAYSRLPPAPRRVCMGRISDPTGRTSWERSSR